jgi:hypothetical protein
MVCWNCTSDNAPSEARKRGSGGGSPRKYDNVLTGPSDLDVQSMACLLFGCGILENPGLLQQKDVSFHHWALHARHCNCRVGVIVQLLDTEPAHNSCGDPKSPAVSLRQGHRLSSLPWSPIVSKTSSHHTKVRFRGSGGCLARTCLDQLGFRVVDLFDRGLMAQ